MSVRGLRVAIVGGGPRGLYALDSLSRAVRRAESARVIVDVFEPHPTPGAGPVYDPDQPPFLVMNFAASLIDAWTGDTADRPSFVEWWRATRHADPPTYPPRAAVGEYLADCLARVLDAAPDGLTVTVRRQHVEEVRRSAGGWRVATADGAAAYDEVLIATGHLRTWPGALVASRGGATPVTGVFPVQRELRRSRVPSGAVVAVRGFALTFIDAALALTEGRGGRFSSSDGGRLRYTRSGAEPEAILPFSRTGRPLLAKPAGAPAGPVASALERGRTELASLADLDLRDAVVPVLARTAGAVLAASGVAGGADPLTAAAAARLEALITGAGVGDVDPVAEITRSCEVVADRGAPGVDWAVGTVWRGLYPQVVGRLGHGGLVEHDWPRFHRLAAEMERLAFGPPRGNAEKLLALVAAGIVDLGMVAGGRLVPDGDGVALEGAAGRRPVDVVVDAVLAPPGVPAGASGPAAGLVEDGTVRLIPGGRGLDVLVDGTCRDRGGDPVLGLAAVGRLTEDAVIGNDTLSRTLHDVPERWAARVVRRAQWLAPASTAGAR